MSTSRVLSIFVALALIVGVVVTVQAGIGKSIGNFSAQAALDQHERHPGFINPDVPASLSALAAEQARSEYRRGEWTADSALYTPLDAHERHAVSNLALSAEQARLEFRRGEWNAGNSVAAPDLDAEAARWVAMGKFYAKLEAQRIQRVQDADAARWTAMAKFYASLQSKP